MFNLLTALPHHTQLHNCEGRKGFFQKSPGKLIPGSGGGPDGFACMKERAGEGGPGWGPHFVPTPFGPPFWQLKGPSLPRSHSHPSAPSQPGLPADTQARMTSRLSWHTEKLSLSLLKRGEGSTLNRNTSPEWHSTLLGDLMTWDPSLFLPLPRENHLTASRGRKFTHHGREAIQLLNSSWG